MKVLLYKDIQKLGYLGDIVEVNEGYARNYLFPQGLAKRATENNIRAIAQDKARAAEVRIEERKRLETAAQAVEGAEAVLAAKANEQGHLFGSITEKMIAQNLREQGFQVADEIVVLPEHIKERYVNDAGDMFLVTLYPREQIWDYAAMRRFDAQLAQVHPRVTGTPPLFLRLIDYIARDGLIATMLTIVIVVLLLNGD